MINVNERRGFDGFDDDQNPVEACMANPLTATELNRQYLGNPEPPDKWPVIKPLSSDLLPVKPITPDMLPEDLRDWVQDETERMDNASFEFSAVACVIALAVLVGKKVTVSPKQFDTWRVVPNLWGALIGQPSEKKSPSIKKMLAPIVKLATKARAEHKDAMKEYEAKIRIHDISEKEYAADIKKQVKIHKEKGKEEALGEAMRIAMDDSLKPEKPVEKRYIVNDSSIEQIGVLLQENPQGLLLLRDELHGFIAGMDRAGHEQDRAFYLEAANGDSTFSYDRVSRPSIFIPSNTVSILGGTQISRIIPLLKTRKDGSGDDGLLERFQLMVYPGTYTFKYVDRKPDKTARNKAYRVFKDLDKIPNPMIECEDDHEDVDYSDTIHFDSEAQIIFNDWYCQLMTRITRHEKSTHIDSCLGKYPSLMASLALIFHLVKHGWNNVDVPCIDKGSTNLAIRWCEVLETHARRIYAVVEDPMASARSLLRNLGKLDKQFKSADIERKGWKGLDTAQERNTALAVLTEHGYIAQVVTKPETGRPSVDYFINPEFLNKQEHPSKNQ